MGRVPDVAIGSGEVVTWAADLVITGPDQFTSLAVTDSIPFGFEYVPGSARLAVWSDATGTAHVPLGDPLIGTSSTTCASAEGWHRATDDLNSGSNNFVGQAPAVPLTWTFARGGEGVVGAPWDDSLAYLSEQNASAARVTTAFDRLVRVVFEVRPTAAFDDCVQTPLRSPIMRSSASATGVHSRGVATATGLGWVVGFEFARVSKSPDAALSPDGATAVYDIDVMITDPTQINTTVSGNYRPGAVATAVEFGPPPAGAWYGFGDNRRDSRVTQTWFQTDVSGPPTIGSNPLIVTDTFVDDGLYVPGSATFEMRDPWGRAFDGHLASEEVEVVDVGGRQASRVTWTFDYYPATYTDRGRQIPSGESRFRVPVRHLSVLGADLRTDRHC